MYLTYIRAIYASECSIFVISCKSCTENQTSLGMEGSGFLHYYTGNQQQTWTENKVGIPQWTISN